MAGKEFSIQGKIIVIVFVLFIPIILVSTVDPIADELGICIEDICLNENSRIPNRCFPEDSTTCVYELRQAGNEVVLLDQPDRWIIQGDGVICETIPQILQTNCENVAIFEKDEYSLRQETVNDRELTVFVLKP